MVDPATILRRPARTRARSCLPGHAGLQSYDLANGNRLQRRAVQPADTWEISPRIDLALGEKNTLTTRFQYETERSEQNAGIGGLDLSSRATTRARRETTIQVSDTQIF